MMPARPSPDRQRALSSAHGSDSRLTQLCEATDRASCTISWLDVGLAGAGCACRYDTALWPDEAGGEAAAAMHSSKDDMAAVRTRLGAFLEEELALAK